MGVDFYGTVAADLLPRRAAVYKLEGTECYKQVLYKRGMMTGQEQDLGANAVRGADAGMYGKQARMRTEITSGRQRARLEEIRARDGIKPRRQKADTEFSIVPVPKHTASTTHIRRRTLTLSSRSRSAVSVGSVCAYLPLFSADLWLIFTSKSTVCTTLAAILLKNIHQGFWKSPARPHLRYRGSCTWFRAPSSIL